MKSVAWKWISEEIMEMSFVNSRKRIRDMKNPEK